MTIENLLETIRRDRLFVSNCYEGTDGKWRAFLRDKKNGLAIHRGVGDSLLSALEDAYPKKSRDYSGLLG